MKIPVKLVFLICYVTVLFVMARLHSLYTWYLGSHPSHQVSPSSLSVSELKGLLDQRGVFYGDALEKTELVQRVQHSGHVTADEMDSLKQMAVAAQDDTLFTTVLDYSLDVDSSRDTAWLVMVVAGDENDDNNDNQHKLGPMMGERSWRTLRKRALQLGVRTGVLNCSLDREGCYQRGWHGSSLPKLQLSLPRLEYTNPRVYTFFGRTLTEHKVYNWLVDKLQYNVKNISTPDKMHMEQTLLQNPLDQQENLVVLFARRSTPIPFFAALSANFAAFAKFVWVDPGKEGLEEWTEGFRIDSTLPLPVILVANSEGTYVYGSASECFNYSCLKTCLSFFRPGQNFGLNVSFVLAILFTIFDGFRDGGVTGVLYAGFKYCSLVAIVWLLLSIGGERFVPIKLFNAAVLKVTRFLATTRLGAMIRQDVILFSGNLKLLFLSLLPAACAMTALNDNDENGENNTNGGNDGNSGNDVNGGNDGNDGNDENGENNKNGGNDGNDGNGGNDGMGEQNQNDDNGTET